MLAKFIFSVAILGIVGTTRCEETLLQTGDTRYGGYAGPVLKFSSVNEEMGTWVGMRGGLLVNSVFSIGGEAYGLWSDVDADQPDTSRLMVGVMGFVMEAVFSPSKVVHGTSSLLIGVGGVGTGGWHQGMRRADADRDIDRDAVLVLEPETNLEINVTPFFRFCPGLSYRWIIGDARAVESNWDVSSLSGNLLLKFGKF